MTGKSYTQTKKVTFKNDKAKNDEYTRLEYCHNLIVQTQPDESHIREYEKDNTVLMAWRINDLNSKITIQGASFAQQYLIQKGLKVFGEEGRKALLKEMDQLHRRNYFTPRSITEMTAI
jgi:hypothetical protein